MRLTQGIKTQSPPLSLGQTPSEGGKKLSHKPDLATGSRLPTPTADGVDETRKLADLPRFDPSEQVEASQRLYDAFLAAQPPERTTGQRTQSPLEQLLYGGPSPLDLKALEAFLVNITTTGARPGDSLSFLQLAAMTFGLGSAAHMTHSYNQQVSRMPAYQKPPGVGPIHGEVTQALGALEEALRGACQRTLEASERTQNSALPKPPADGWYPEETPNPSKQEPVRRLAERSNPDQERDRPMRNPAHAQSMRNVGLEPDLEPAPATLRSSVSLKVQLTDFVALSSQHDVPIDLAMRAADLAKTLDRSGKGPEFTFYIPQAGQVRPEENLRFALQHLRLLDEEYGLQELVNGKFQPLGVNLLPGPPNDELVVRDLKDAKCSLNGMLCVQLNTATGEFTFDLKDLEKHRNRT